MIGLCDCNNFFVSCERVFKPQLRGKAVVVLSSNDGCAIARSNEAKTLGVKMAQPAYQFAELINSNQVTVISCNIILYGDMSNRVMTTLKSIAPNVEIYSIDEAFIDMNGFDAGKLKEIGEKMASTVYQNVGLPVSIGIAPTKTLAKIASKLCKQYPKLNNCCVMSNQEDIEKVLKSFPLADVWGIGRKYTKTLQQYGIATAWNFTQAPEYWVRKIMGVTGLRTWNELRGVKCIEFEEQVDSRKQIGVSRSFANEIYEFEEVRSFLAQFVSTACEKLRRENSMAQTLKVYVMTNRHKPEQPQHLESKIITFQTPTASTLEMIDAAVNLLRSLFREGYGYKKTGLVLENLTPKAAQQTSIFDTTNRPKQAQLMKAIDKLNDTMGRGTIVSATAGFKGVRFSHNHLSPRYTTQWKDIIKVKV